MPRADQRPIQLIIVIETPVAGVAYSLQSKDGQPLHAKRSSSDDALRFDVPIRIGPGPKFFGDQVRREGKERRFVYIRIGQSAGDHASPWSRRMKIDIHDLPEELLEESIASGRPIEIVINGTGKDGTPACATVRRNACRLARRRRS